MKNQNISQENTAVNPENIRSVLDQFPQDFEAVTEEFLKRYSEQIQFLNSAFKDQGGISLIEIDNEMQVICRVPSKSILDDTRKKTENMNATDADMYLVSLCALYPSGQQIRYWMDHGSPGVASVIARELLEEAKVTVKARRKKL